MPRIKKSAKTGFCFGVKRALAILEKIARERSCVETLGAVVHNQQVLERLAGIGVRVVNRPDEISGDTIVTSSHGISPEMEEMIRQRGIKVVSTTCPFVRRAQLAARRLAAAGLFVIVFGNKDHPEVRGILGWAGGKGLATTEVEAVAALQPLPRRLGILSQTTQVPGRFIDFTQKIIALALKQDAEIRIINTICHDIPERQAAALELARRADLMLVVGGRNSANTTRLAELCAALTETHHIETAAEIDPAWLKSKRLIGITGGASTAEEDVAEVARSLEGLLY